MRVIPDEATRLAALKRGEIDIAYSVRGELAAELRQTPGLELKPALVQGVHDLAVHVELELGMGGIADANWSAFFVARQPSDLALGKLPLPCQAVHNLQLFRLSGDGA